MSLTTLGAGPGSGSSPWTPADLPSLTATLLVSQQRESGLLWQNAAKTVPAVADGDRVRVAVCPYTGIELAAGDDAERGTLTDDGGGAWSLTFTGSEKLYIPYATLGDAIPYTVAAAYYPTTSGQIDATIIQTNFGAGGYVSFADYDGGGGTRVVRGVGPAPGNWNDHSTGGVAAWRSVIASASPDGSRWVRFGGTKYAGSTATPVTPGACDINGILCVGDLQITGAVCCASALSDDDAALLETFLDTLIP